MAEYDWLTLEGGSLTAGCLRCGFIVDLYDADDESWSSFWAHHCVPRRRWWMRGWKR